MQYETVIGLEIHCELATKTKIFCSCANEFGGEANTRCCPVCLGIPGALPVMNREAVALAVKAGLALNCSISHMSRFDRKHYFYPDLPKGYQTSQYEFPICTDGYLNIFVNGTNRRIGITRIHLEEDAGKLVHNNSGQTFLDMNRCGVPLIEIVTEPDIHSAEEAKCFLETLRSNMMYAGVSDCRMEQGSLRCDVNVSVRPLGQRELGTRCELKNISSFRGVLRAIKYEERRQIELLKRGDMVLQETRRWDDVHGISVLMRTKEDLVDYRYFPCPDLPPIELNDEYIQCVRSSMPELPEKKKQRYMREMMLSEYDASVLVSDKDIASFFEECIALYDRPKIICNWILGDILKAVRETKRSFSDIKPEPNRFVGLIQAIDRGELSTAGGKAVLEELLSGCKEEIREIIRRRGLQRISNASEILEAVTAVLDSNPIPVAEVKAGKERVLFYLMGQVMRATEGNADHKMVEELIRTEIDKR